MSAHRGAITLKTSAEPMQPEIDSHEGARLVPPGREAASAVGVVRAHGEASLLTELHAKEALVPTCGRMRRPRQRRDIKCEKTAPTEADRIVRLNRIGGRRKAKRTADDLAEADIEGEGLLAGVLRAPELLAWRNR